MGHVPCLNQDWMVIPSHQLEVPVWSERSLGAFLSYIGPPVIATPTKRLSYKKPSRLRPSYLTRKKSVPAIYQMSLFLNRLTQWIVQLMCREISAYFYHTSWSACMRMRPFLLQEIAYLSSFFFKVEIFASYRFIFRPCFAFLSSYDHQLPQNVQECI